MLTYPVGHGTQLPMGGRVFSRGGLPKLEFWKSGLTHLSYRACKGWSPKPSTNLRAQSLSVQPSEPNDLRARERRPEPPQLERAGDLTGRLLNDYLSCWGPQYTEYDYYLPPEAICGKVPEEVRGTLFLIGPSLTEAYGTSVRHPADADGMVCSLAFGDGGQIFFRNRYVRTSSFVAEQVVGHRLTRGLHDRGAPVLMGYKQQQDEHNKEKYNNKENRGHPTQNKASQQSHQHQNSKQHKSVAARGQLPRQASHRRLAENNRKAVAARTKFDNNEEEKEDEEGADIWIQKNQFSPLEAIAAAAMAAGQAVPKDMRLDPFTLLGLPSPPPLSALFNPLDLAFRAPANASVVHWGGRLLAFTEGGSLPYELNKLTLETVGQYDVAGRMADIGRLVGGYKIAPAPYASQKPSSNTNASGDGDGGGGDGERPQRLVLMGAAQSGPDALLRWVEVGEDGRPAGPAITYRMTGATALGLRDFWVTERYYVVVQAPLDFNPQRFATEATLGAASFAECFDWDAGRPSRIHLVRRGGPAATATSSSFSSSNAAAVTRTRTLGVGISGAPWVWPRPGPEAIVVDAPPLMPVSCVGCYPSRAADEQLLVFDAICQQGLSGTGEAALISLNPAEHRRQPKPELTRIVVDLRSGTASARVLSQRTASAATTAAAFVACGGRSGGTATAAGPSLAPLADGYHCLYAAASANDTAEGWAPSQVLLKLTLQPSYAVPTAVAGGGSDATESVNVIRNIDVLARWRGTGAELWCPGDRAFVGPPVFIPRRLSAAQEVNPGGSVDGGLGWGADTGGPMAAGVGQGPASTSPLPSLGPQVEEQEGWLLVMVHDAASMTAELCVLDARDVTRGPVAVVRLPHHLPHVRGAHFTRSYCGPGLTAPPGWRPRTAASGPGKSPAGHGAKVPQKQKQEQ